MYDFINVIKKVPQVQLKKIFQTHIVDFLIIINQEEDMIR